MIRCCSTGRQSSTTICMPMKLIVSSNNSNRKCQNWWLNCLTAWNTRGLVQSYLPNVQMITQKYFLCDLKQQQYQHPGACSQLLTADTDHSKVASIFWFPERDEDQVQYSFLFKLENNEQYHTWKENRDPMISNYK